MHFILHIIFPFFLSIKIFILYKIDLQNDVLFVLQMNMSTINTIDAFFGAVFCMELNISKCVHALVNMTSFASKSRHFQKLPPLR